MPCLLLSYKENDWLMIFTGSFLFLVRLLAEIWYYGSIVSAGCRFSNLKLHDMACL